MRKAEVLLHTLTAIHGLGAVALVLMAAFVWAGSGNADRLAVTPGGRQLVDWTGAYLPVFFLALAAFLAALAIGSHRRQRWSWPAAVTAYTIGVLGSLAELLAGHVQYVASLTVNALVVGGLLAPSVRRAFRPREP